MQVVFISVNSQCLWPAQLTAGWPGGSLSGNKTQAAKKAGANHKQTGGIL